MPQEIVHAQLPPPSLGLPSPNSAPFLEPCLLLLKIPLLPSPGEKVFLET